MGISYPSTAGVNPTGSVYNDGNSVYGSASVTINGTATYDTDNFSPSFPANRKEQTNRYGVPIRAFGLPVTPSASMTLQIPTTATYMPAPGNTVVVDIATGTWFVDNVNPPYRKDDYLLVAITVHQKLN